MVQRWRWRKGGGVPHYLTANCKARPYGARRFSLNPPACSRSSSSGTEWPRAKAWREQIANLSPYNQSNTTLIGIIAGCLLFLCRARIAVVQPIKDWDCERATLRSTYDSSHTQPRKLGIRQECCPLHDMRNLPRGESQACVEFNA